MIDTPLILGSGSPQRKRILGFFSIPFEIVSHVFDETQVPFGGNPAAYVTALSEGKARSLADRFANRVILTADSSVLRGGEMFNKPVDETDGLNMLRRLNGSEHSVFTAVTATLNGEMKSIVAETKVLFRHVSEKHLKAYHAAFSGMDKAGGYGIQQAGSIIIKEIKGCFYNVVGLPISALEKTLGAVGVDLWHYL